jgi:hypothetical protein
LFDGVKPLPRILEQFNLDQQPSWKFGLFTNPTGNIYQRGCCFWMWLSNSYSFCQCHFQGHQFPKAIVFMYWLISSITYSARAILDLDNWFTSWQLIYSTLILCFHMFNSWNILLAHSLTVLFTVIMMPNTILAIKQFFHGLNQQISDTCQKFFRVYKLLCNAYSNRPIPDFASDLTSSANIWIPSGTACLGVYLFSLKAHSIVFWLIRW